MYLYQSIIPVRTNNQYVTGAPFCTAFRVETSAMFNEHKHTEPVGMFA